MDDTSKAAALAVVQNRSQAPAAFIPMNAEFGVAREAELARLWKALWRRRRLLVAVFAAFVATVVVLTLLRPKMYTTDVKLIAGNGSRPSAVQGDTNLPVLDAMLAQSGISSAETYAELLHEAPIAEEVVSRLHLNVSTGTLLSRVAIHPLTNTNVLTVSVSWGDAATSAQIANAYASVFVDHQRALIASQADAQVGFLQRALPEAQEHLSAAQNALAAYQQKTGITDLAAQTQSNIATVAALDAKAQSAQLDSRQAAAQLAAVNGLLAQTPQTVAGAQDTVANPVAASLDQQISQATVDLSSARQQYTDRHPAVIALREKLAQLERERNRQLNSVVSSSSRVPNPLYQQLAQQHATLEAQVASTASQVATLRHQQLQARPLLARLPQQMQRIGDLQRQAKSAEDVYSAIQTKLQNAMIARTTALSDVTITQKADPSLATRTPNLLFNLGVAIVAGLALAISVVLVVEFFDDRFRNEDDIKERLGLPVLASIPHVDLQDKKTSSWVEPLSVEAFFQLVASLRYSSNRPPQTIAITSPTQGDGKSTIAVNTAISMASMHARVLVIDADLRRPTIHEKLKLTNERGLSDVLVGVLPLEEAIRPSGFDGVWVLTSGRRAPNPVGLLQSESFKELLAESRNRFDAVIVDAPALRSIVDGVIIGIEADAAVLVVSSKRSTGRMVRDALAKLRAVHGLNLIGVVLNETKPDVADYSDYYLGSGQTVSLPLAAGL